VKPLLTRDEALDLVARNVTRKNIVYHILAVEAIMRSVAKYFGENEDEWGLIGLLHDIDYEKTEATPEKHSILAEEILNGLVPTEFVRAVKTHNFRFTGVIPETRKEKALIASDAISGLLVACALVMPSKKLAEVKAQTVTKKFKDKDFAKGVERDRILVCETIGIPKEKFFEIALNGLRNIAKEISL
jgi:putative nucleotidyltransferase with HDIG domain